jgi:hypothetical protein
MPLYALYDGRYPEKVRFAAGIGDDNPLDLNTLRTAIKTCLQVARPSDSEQELRGEAAE